MRFGMEPPSPFYNSSYYCASYVLVLSEEVVGRAVELTRDFDPSLLQTRSIQATVDYEQNKKRPSRRLRRAHARALLYSAPSHVWHSLVVEVRLHGLGIGATSAGDGVHVDFLAQQDRLVKLGRRFDRLRDGDARVRLDVWTIIVVGRGTGPVARRRRRVARPDPGPV